MPELPTPPKPRRLVPSTPRGRLILFGGLAAAVLVTVWLVRRHRAAQESAAAVGLAEDQYGGVSEGEPYGPSLLSPITSGAAAGGAYPGGSVTTYTPDDLLEIVKGLTPPPLPTPAAAPVPTPNYAPTPTAEGVYYDPPAPPPPPPPVSAPPKGVDRPPATAPAPAAPTCPPAFPNRSDRGCYKNCGHNECRNHRRVRDHGHCYQNGTRIHVNFESLGGSC